jgi:predicted MPP superfamily phosphohydrolase
MALFLSSFLVLYSLLNAYLFVRARTALQFGAWVAIPFLIFLLAMVVAPIMVQLSENAGLTWLARIIYVVGFTWLGLLFLFVCMTIVIDAARLLALAAGKISGFDLTALTHYGKAYFLTSLALIAAIGTCGFFEARTIRCERITLHTSKFPVGARPVRIAQISDVHLGLGVREGRLARITEQVEKAKPDILVSTGDLVDGQMNKLNGFSTLINHLKPRYGKFAVTGNHEFYAGLDQALAFTRKAGFRVLRGEAVTIPNVMTVVGVDDPAGPGTGSSQTGEKEVLASVPHDLFVLFLKHRPSVATGNSGLFDLQLSGHAHYGQIFPFRLIVRLFYPLVGGLYHLPDSSVYVSRGTGTWGPPIRFLAPPEITIIDVVPQEGR